jgi:hypothetical protein
VAAIKRVAILLAVAEMAGQLLRDGSIRSVGGTAAIPFAD